MVGALQTSTDMLKSGHEDKECYQTLLDDWNSTPTKHMSGAATV
jgi:hypothetical protein